MNKAETKEYMRAYYLAHKEERHLEYVMWCNGNPKRNRAERGKENKTSEERKEYARKYYAAHKKGYAELHRRWCAKNQEQSTDGQQVWRDKNPHYPRDYARKRLAVVDPLIFQFLDGGGLGENPNEFILYLRSQGVSERHTNWFKTDLNKCLSGNRERRRP